jgi:hypothetical protein
MSKSKPDPAEEYAEEYCDLLRLNFGPITRNDVVRAFITGFRAGEIHQADRGLQTLIEYDPETDDS